MAILAAVAFALAFLLHLAGVGKWVFDLTYIGFILLSLAVGGGISLLHRRN